MWRAALLTVAVLVAGGCRGGSAGSLTSAAPTSEPSSQVVFQLEGKTPASDSVRGGGGSGTFTLSGAVSDSGTFLDYRRQKGESIVIRRVLTGKTGKLTMVIHISTSSGDKGWRVVSGSGAYAGAHGRGDESGGVDGSGNLSITMNGSLTGT